LKSNSFGSIWACRRSSPPVRAAWIGPLAPQKSKT
jgi:hypothetical protein